MTHSPPPFAPTLLDTCAHLRRICEAAARRNVTLTATTIDEILAVVCACELAFSSVPAVAGEGP